MLLAANITVEEEVILIVFLLYAFLTKTKTRSIEAEKQGCSETLTPELGLQNLRACKMWTLNL